MRISDSILTSMITTSMDGTYNNYANIIQKIASNKNFTKVSENPQDATKILKIDDHVAKLNVYQSNINAATNEMNYVYDTLGGMQEEMTAINSLILEASNATTDPDSAKAIANEIKERVYTIQDKMNAKYLDNYVFSGTFTGTMAFSKDENGDIIYTGSSDAAGKRTLTISEGTLFPYNVTGDSLLCNQEYYFDDGNGARQAVKSDFFSQMKDLDTLLNADTLDYNKIREKLQVTEKSINNVTSAQGKISGEVSKLDATKTLNDTALMGLTEDKVALEEVDIVKAATDLANAQSAMQASYLVGTRVLNNVSLLDYI